MEKIKLLDAEISGSENTVDYKYSVDLESEFRFNIDFLLQCFNKSLIQSGISDPTISIDQLLRIYQTAASLLNAQKTDEVQNIIAKYVYHEE